METHKNLAVHFFTDQKAWEKWLEKHYSQTEGVWVKFAKKASGITSLNYDQALEVALCFGWIDGLHNSLNETYHLQKFTPRRPKSMWSKRNIAKVAALTKAGKMKPSGLLEVERAKQDGRWAQAYDSPSTITMHPEFKKALENHPKAKEFFATLNKTNTYAILLRIHMAKKPETRKSRIDKFIIMLSEGKKIY
jgi:uncharacterized protein YdeI (YjbR/CyaY-like superfamily)